MSVDAVLEYTHEKIQLDHLNEEVGAPSQSASTNSLASQLDQFSAIGLDKLNAKAEMLDRIDNKYIVSKKILRPTLNALTNKFDILEIENKRAFRYSTRYFDDAKKRGYYDHHQRKRKRCKARVREYVDAGFSYLEVKTNERRSTTLKRRLPVDKPLQSLDARCMEFIADCYDASYHDKFEKTLLPVILINYERITLVAKEGGERLTIDTHLSFHSSDVNRLVPDDLFIVETKSAKGNGIADKILRELHVQPTKRVSKYCMGMALTGQVSRFNGFLPALRRLNMSQAFS